MKINKYNEHINWEFYEDETDERKFRIGDSVKLPNIYERTANNSLNYIKIKVKMQTSTESLEIVDIKYRTDGEMIIKLYNRWPWYVAKYF